MKSGIHGVASSANDTSKFSQIYLELIWGASLNGVDFRTTNLADVRMAGASLRHARFSGSVLDRAILSEADLSNADFSYAQLDEANFICARLSSTVFEGSTLYRCLFTAAELSGTFFLNVDLSGAAGLDDCIHLGMSYVDFRTLQRSGRLPYLFLRRIGLSELLINYLPSLLEDAIQRYSCFISYSTKDLDFAVRLHSDLLKNGVRCWFAPDDMPTGGKILDEIDSAIRLRDKVLLILSEHSIKSDWVEDEVTKAFEEERERGQTVLFPVRLDDAVMKTNEPWVMKLRARHIGDFTRWKDHDAYSKSFARVLRDLTVKKDQGGA